VKDQGNERKATGRLITHSLTHSLTVREVIPKGRERGELDRSTTCADTSSIKQRLVKKEIEVPQRDLILFIENRQLASYYYLLHLFACIHHPIMWLPSDDEEEPLGDRRQWQETKPNPANLPLSCAYTQL